MSDTKLFYRQFEDRYRGSQEAIESRLRFYLPWINQLRSLDDSLPRAIDLGCGRGEWLQLLSDAGFEPLGVDLDDGMLKACEERGLFVQKKDVLTALKETPAESQLLVSAFHLVEHITFDDLHLLINECFRVLKPGGLLILETPNPENFRVASWGFYLDPSHQRPIPPLLLEFLVGYIGFDRVKILRLHEPPHLLDERQQIRLEDILGGVSPDYAVIAQKSAKSVNQVLWDPLFSVEYGITLENLLEKQLRQHEDRMTFFHSQIDGLSRRLAKTESQVAQLNGLFSWLLSLKKRVGSSFFGRIYKKWRK